MASGMDNLGKTSSNKVSIASLNFVDMRCNSGPAVNEVEFNTWLLENFEDVRVYSPHESDRLGGEFLTKTTAMGGHTLRAPINFLRQQLHISKLLSEDLELNGILYCRHSRLCFATAMIQRKRPDILLIMTRCHPAGSDTAMSMSSPKRLLAAAIDWLDEKLRKHIFRNAHWVDCVTEVQAKQLEKDLERPVNVVMNGVNTNRFYPRSISKRCIVRRKLDIPEDAIVVGYCGGFAEQRGAKDVAAAVSGSPKIFGIIIGSMSDEICKKMANERIRFLGELDYEAVGEFIAIFDVAVAFDAEGRADSIGNSNQKIRQGLASGAWILSQGSDLPFDEMPYLGCHVSERSAENLVANITAGQMYFHRREERAAYAREYLSTDRIFRERHGKIERRASP